jgi:8-hydroxy-5-deazaflavin:NADPH oxidoreductase
MELCAVGPMGKQNSMRIGIIGAGKVGGGLGKLWVRSAHQVFFSSRLTDSSATSRTAHGSPSGGSLQTMAMMHK